MNAHKKHVINFQNIFNKYFQYDPKSRYTFAELVKKLTMLLENPNAATIHYGSSAANSNLALNNSNCSLNGQLEKSVSTSNGTIVYPFLKNSLSKRNSIDSPVTYQPSLEMRKNS